jgi:transcriptional regulator with XRE-family HTH domain
MDAATQAMAAAIGARVRESRQAHGWTLDQLADASGVSRRMVVNVEQGEANPSVGTLLRISDALGIGLPALVQDAQPKPVQVTRADDAAVLWTGDAGGRGLLVAGTNPPDVVELWDWTLGPGDSTGSEAHTAGTKELVHVLAGTVALEAAGQTVTLGVGDAASFPGDEPHILTNSGEEPARFTLAVFEPGVGTQAHAGTGDE